MTDVIIVGLSPLQLLSVVFVPQKKREKKGMKEILFTESLEQEKSTRERQKLRVKWREEL